MPRRRKSNTGLITVIASFLCVICVACSILGLVLSNGGILSSPAPTPLQVEDSSLSIPTIIALSFSAANAQTAAAYSPTPLASATLAPALDATATVFIFDLQTNVARPTDFLFSTNTPFVLATAPPPTAGGAVCSCSGGLDCGDFSTHNQAQDCFEYCRSLGLGDVHGLDGNDQDGLACESLP